MKKALTASIALAFAFAACSTPTGTTPGASGSPFALSSGSPAATAAASPIASSSAGALYSAAPSASGALSTAAASGSPSAFGSPVASASAGAVTTSSPAASAASAGTSAQTQCTSTLQAGQAGASSVIVDVGTLVDRSDAESVIGPLTATPARVDIPVTGFVISACVYESADGSMSVALGPANISKTDFENLMKLMPNATQLSGVGDSAFSIKVTPTAGLAGAASIFVHSGSSYFTLQAASKTKSSDALLSSLQDVAMKASKKL